MAKISFTVGAKQEPSDLTSTIANPLNNYSRLKDGYLANDSVASDDVAVISSKTSKAPLALPTSTESAALQSKSSASRAASTLDRWDRSQHPRSNISLSKQHSVDMAEPPAKRAKRTDSAAMWEHTSKPTDTRNKPRDPPGDTKPKEGRDRRDDKARKHGREERPRRSRSRSRERRRDRDGQRRKDRSRSEERRGGRLANGSHSPPRERDGKRRREGERRDRDRSLSRERHRSRRGKRSTLHAQVSDIHHITLFFDASLVTLFICRKLSSTSTSTLCRSVRHNPCASCVAAVVMRLYWQRTLTDRTKDEPPARRSDRHRSRSRSPTRDPKSTIRTRSPRRGPSSKPPPSGPYKPSKTSASPPPGKDPPKGPKSSNNPPLPKTNGTASTAPSNAKVAAAPSSKMEIDEDSDPETAQMRRMMGFADFKTTKNTKVPGNDVYAVRKEKKTEYRQYMNRVGGFNRPLSPSR